MSLLLLCEKPGLLCRLRHKICWGIPKIRKMGIVILLLVAALLIMVVVYVSGADGKNRTTVSSLDLPRYMGVWYEIARYDHPFERGLERVQAQYELRPNGCVGVLNSGTDFRTGRRKQAHGKARASRLPGRLRVSFFWIFYSDYNIMELADDYGWALVGGSSPKFLWILSRTPVLPSRTLNHILRLAEQRGYRTDKLLFVEQAG